MATTTTTSGGTVTSLSNTPQAQDDIFTTGVIGTSTTAITEDLLGVVYLDVMSNDLGGSAKTLWSLDDATSLSTATKVYAPADLLIQDTGRIEATSTDTSSNGAKIWITSDGKVGYDAATLSTAFKAQLQSLAGGGSLTDTFTYAIRLGNGTLSWATAQVQFAGMNDSVTMSIGVQAGTVTEDATTTPSPTDSLSATGTIAFSDVDLSDTHTASFVAAGGNATALGNFTLASVTEAANAADGTINWTYTLDNAAAQSLAQGQTVTETYVVTISDGHGSSTTQNVTITITGTNDQVQITSGVQAGDAGEDSGDYAASGSITFTDVDLIDTHSVTVTPGASGYLGSFTTDPLSDSTGTGSGSLGWNFAVNNTALQFLGEGQSVTQTYNVAIGDGALQTVTITITGINDQVQITSGVQADDAGEDSGNYAASGSITFADVDLIDTHSVSVTPGASGYLGSFTTNPLSDSTGTGSGSLGWNFAVNNTALQFLGEGQIVTQTYNVAIGDGAVQTVTITITGINDQVQITSGVQAGDAGEDSGDYAASGSITFADVDLIDTHSVTVTPGASGYLGSFTTDPLSDSTGTGNGSLGWNFAVNNTALQFLGEGQSVTQTYNVAIGDGAVQTVTITITGINDQVQITSGVQAGDAGEDSGDYAASGNITFTDVDLIETHSVSVTPGASGYLGSFTTNPLSDSTGTGSGSLGWNFAVNNTALQFLGEGQIVTQTYNVAIGDGAVQTVTITITGTNDQPTLTMADSTGAMNEGNGTATLSDSGALSFADLDSNDTVTVSQTANGDIAWSGGTLNAGVASALVAGFSVDQNSWDYSSNQNLDFLGAGETITFSYAVVATDDSGTANAASATQTVTITITGTNDQPTLTITDSTGAMSEGNGTATLSDSGALSFADLDSTDTVTVSQTANGDIAWSSGTLNAGVASALVAGFSVDQNSWDYSSNQNLDFLGAGETITFSYAVVATDDSGTANAASATQTVTITITGTNDQPTLTMADSTGAMNEGNGNATLSDSGALSFADLDSTDTVTVSQTANGDIAWSGGTLNAGVASALVAGFSVDQNSWDYSSNQNLDFLGAGETISFSYAVVATDDSGAANAASATQTVTITITGTNDQPTLTMADSTGAMNEGNGNATLSDSGALSFADLDSTDTVTVSQTANGDIAWSGGTLNAGVASALVAGFSVDQNSWDYSSNQNLDFLGAGETISFSYAVVATDDSGAANAASAVQTVTITITGSNDAAVLSSANVTLTETNAPLSTSGTLTISDVDSAATFVAQANTAGSYGQFSIGTGGAWTYIADSAHNEFVAGTTYTDTFAVSSADGTVTSVTVHILGSNDAAVLSSASVTLTETNAPLTTGATLTISDIDSPETFQAQSGTAGANGTFAINTAGNWSYTANSAFDTLNVGDSLTDTFTVLSADGTATAVTVTIKGSNDAAVLSSASVTLTETNAPLTTTGTLTISDVDSLETFQAQSGTTGTNGTFAIDAAGNWSYTANSAFDSLNVGDSLTDTFTVLSADGTATAVTVTIKGSNDAAVLSSASVTLTETNAPLTTTGTLTISDVDSLETFQAQSGTTGTNGTFAIDAAGNWSYTANSAFDSLNVGDSLSDTFTVLSADGTATAVTVTINGSNDSPTITSNGGGATASVNVAENTAAVTTVAATDVDLPAQTLSYSILNTAGTDFSKFSISSSGVLTFNSAPDYENAQDVGGADGDNAYVVDVLVADGNGGTDTQTITVNVQNVVETPVDMTPPASPTGLTYNKTGGPNHKLSGSAEANSSIKVYLDNGNGVFGAGDTEIGTGTTNTGGQFANIDLDGKFTGTKTLFVTATDAAGNVSAATSISLTYPAGVSGEAINLAIADPSAGLSDSFVVTVTDVPSNWILNTGTNNGDGSWTVQTSDPGALTVTTPEGFTGAAVLHINMTWTNADGSVGSSYVFNNVEAFAPGAPIFALSADDNLTGSSGADTFVFAQPIGNNQIYSFDVTADKIDLIGFTGITSFADLNITNDANGNALVSIGSGQSVTLKGVDAADLSEANFQFDVDPVMTNTGTLTISDGAIMPFGGSIQNSGTIELGSTGSETELEILFRGATLTGGGQVLLSDSAQNVIFGGSADTVLTNADNRISGAGQLGAGQMVLVNAGLILASGLNSLVLDTGSHTITNSGVLESTGEGGMTVASAVDNSGHLWANGGDMRLLADVIGNGSATIDGDATLSFDGAVHGSVAFHGEGAGTLVIAQAEAASSLVGILGLESDDMLTFGDLAFGANTQLSYSANASGAGGLLTVDDGVHRAEVNLLGHYTVEDFQVTGGETGTQVSYNGASSGTLVGSMAADVLSGSDGNDILAGRGGEDTLSGGAGADVFAYLNEAEGGDTILDYNFAEGDSLDLSALLSANFVSGISQASDFVQLAQSGSDITVQVDADGAANGTNFADVAVLANTGTSGTDLVRTWFGEADHTLTA
ncbi:VCBS domain-containing protein [Pseudomonas sp. Irchel s3b2]|uniref:VCBS domain-containing protein n=1 Tax=Pseudomonas sp. Irchel s3b2 TaxID=2009073 RepID=UPI000BA47552|nr:VCBS domain-containing protein [Pseudomonas sp. Irchel s3b2]